LALFHFTTCAAPAFLQRHGTPTTSRGPGAASHGRHDLHSHGSSLSVPLSGRCVVSELALHHQLVVTEHQHCVAAALSGLGIIQAPTYAVHEAVKDGRLLAVLEDRQTPTIPAHVLYAPNRYLSAKVRVFIELGSWRSSRRHDHLRRG
jgi:DNA-binding transcriptional LysR family regulator